MVFGYFGLIVRFAACVCLVSVVYSLLVLVRWLGLLGGGWCVCVPCCRLLVLRLHGLLVVLVVVVWYVGCWLLGGCCLTFVVLVLFCWWVVLLLVLAVLF